MSVFYQQEINATGTRQDRYTRKRKNAWNCVYKSLHSCGAEILVDRNCLLSALAHGIYEDNINIT